MTNLPSVAEFEAYFQQHLPATLDFLQTMVGINSFTNNPEGVNKLGEVTAAHFAQLGFEAETVQAEEEAFGKHLILTRQGGSNRKIGLVSHLDTVFPPDEEIRNDFAWRVEGKRIYGPGTVDIKGGTALIYLQLAALQSLAPHIFEDITWTILFNAAEETGAKDFGPLCCERIDPDALACLVYEGGCLVGDDFWIVQCRKGMARYQVTVIGRAAHAGNSHRDGANAIVQLADVVQQIADFTDHEQNITFNVGAISGGTVTNRVPHFAQAVLEMRAFNSEIFEEGIRQVMAFNEYVSVKSLKDNFPCTVKVEVTRRTDPWPPNVVTDRLLNLWTQTAQSLGKNVIPEARGGLSDGNGIWHTLPTLDGLGPSGSNAHCSERSPDGSKDQEFVWHTSFVPKAVLNTLATLRLITYQRP